MKLKILFFIIGAIVGFQISQVQFPFVNSIVIGLIFGALTVGITLAVEQTIKKLSPQAALGAALGLAVASISFFAIKSVLSAFSIPFNMVSFISAGVFLFLAHLGISVGLAKGKESQQGGGKKGSMGQVEANILDTSVIIDGRIADVAEAGFINGPLIVPKFIIKELQHIADSSEPIKRVRGRRGLDVLKRMQKDIPNVSIQITSHDFPNVKEADLKLVELASKLNGVIITNDFNLNKVADLQDVRVMNLNQLSNALKPVVLPGEAMTIQVVKEGKENNQGVGYLEDGTMVVVDEAKRYMGNEIQVSVTSVLQTPTGRMIFSKVKSADRKGSVSGIRG